MKKVFKATLLTGIMTGLLLSAVPIFAAGPYGGGRNCPAAWKQNYCYRAQSQGYNRARLRDGSCWRANQNNAGSAQQRGNTYGPGDGTGNAGNPPKDGTGYGAPSKK